MLDDRLRTARILVAGVALLMAVVPPLVDFGPSHVTNPLWSGHARLHTVWLVCTNSLISLLALAIVWRGAAEPGPGSVQLAALLVGVVLLGFFAAAASQAMYDGSLTDPNGVPFRFGPIDANLAVFSVYAVVLSTAVWLTRTASPSGRERE